MLIKKFETEKGHYVYDTWTNELLMVDEAVYATLPGGTGSATLRPDARTSAEAEIEQARRDGYLSTERPQVTACPEASFAELREQQRQHGPQDLTLNLTERCNFRCRYCIFSGAYQDMRVHGARRMSRDTLHAAIDWYLGYDRDEYGISFFGGEPLMEFPLLQEAIDHVRRRTDKPVTFSMTTNAALLSPRICRFLVDNRFQLVISIDGPQQVNDRYRRRVDGEGSFEKIWKGINRLYDTDPDYFASNVSFNLVAAPPAALSAIQDFVAAHPRIFEGFKIAVGAVNSSPGELPPEMTAPANRAIAERERDALFDIFAGHLRSGGANLDDFATQVFLGEFSRFHRRPMTRMESVTRVRGQCVPGNFNCAVETDGTLYMCERAGTARPIGHIARGLDEEAIFGFLREYNAFIKDRCSNCWMVRLCTKCHLQFQEGDALSPERLSAFCRAQEAFWGWIIQKYIELREEKADIFSALPSAA
jgi:uncharacterized protein